MAVEGEFPKVDGDVLYASEINSFKRSINQIYTATGFDSAIGPSAAAGNDESSVELTAITAADLVGKLYLKISVLGSTSMSAVGSQTGVIELKIQVKETGGAYGDVLAYIDINSKDVAGGQVEQKAMASHLTYLHTLTAGQLTNGVQVKMFSKSTISSNSASDWARFTNVQTVIELIN